MKWFQSMLAFGLLSVLLVGCGQSSANSQSSSQNENQTTNSAGSSSQSASGIDQGVTGMLSVEDGLDKQIAAGDQVKAAASGEQLEATWHAFEDSVHTRYAANYKDVETYLDPLVAGTKVAPLSKTTLSTLSKQLRHALLSLQGQVKQG